GRGAAVKDHTGRADPPQPPHAPQAPRRPPAPAAPEPEEVLGDDLEAVERRRVLQHAGVVRRPEAHPDLDPRAHRARASGTGRMPGTPSPSRYTLVRAVRYTAPPSPTP